MSLHSHVWSVAALGALVWAGMAQAGPNLGKPATKKMVAAWDISIGPDGVGLPFGRGSVRAGAAIYEAQCAICHGAKGEGGKGYADSLVGGVGSLATPHPVKTVGSYWPYATTLFDYIRRAMPFMAPMSLTNDEVYSVTAYVLWLNGIIRNESYVLDARKLKSIEMPNRHGFIPGDELVPVSISPTQR